MLVEIEKRFQTLIISFNLLFLQADHISSKFETICERMISENNKKKTAEKEIAMNRSSLIA